MLTERENTLIKLSILKEVESLLKENKLQFDGWLNPAKLHQTLMYNPFLVRQLYERAERIGINKEAIDSFLLIINQEYTQDKIAKELKACQDLVRELPLSCQDLSERVGKLMAAWGNEKYTFVNYSYSKGRYVFIDTASLKEFNYNLVEIRENLNNYHLTYVKQLEDLK